jgi:DNA repair protein SbcC/Rad50
MRDLRIRTRNFLSHADSEVRFDGFDSVVVLGPNGTGKSSFLVDSKLVALFGKGRSGDLDGYIRNGSTDMGVEYDFALNGHRYGVIRKRSKRTARGSSSLEFNEINEKGETIQQLTAGTIAETQVIIEKTLGTDFDTLTKTSILEQGEADFFCAATPSERMDLFARIWDLDRYETMAQIARDTWSGLKSQISVIDDKIAGAKQRISEIDGQKESLSTVRKDLERETAGLASLEKKRDEIQKKLGAFENLSQELDKAKGYKSKAEQEIERLGQQHEGVLKKIERFEKILLNQETVRAKVVEEEEKTKSLTMAETDLSAINGAIESIRAEIDQVRKEKQEHIDAIEKERVVVETEIRAMGQKEVALNRELSEVTRKEEQLKHLCIDAEKLKGIACHPDFNPEYVNETCRFIKDAVEAKRLIPDLESEISTRKVELTSNMVALKEQIGLFEEKKARCVSLQGEARDLMKGAISTHERKISDMVSDRNGKEVLIKAVKEELVEIKRYTKLLPEIDLAGKELPSLKDQERTLAKDTNGQVAERDRQTEEVRKLTERLGGRANLETELQSTADKLKEATDHKDELTKRLGFIEAEISQGEQLKDQIGRDEKEIETLDGERALYQILEDAFKQIPYMLISRGLGAVENLANQILGMISQSGLSVKIETEKMTKTTKKVRDEIHLKITDADGSKEYKFLSGGEKVRVAIALRLAISEILAARRGTKIDSLIADEPFNELDAEGIEDLKEAFRKLKERFKFMAVISHITESKDTFDTQLVFSKGPEGSKVEIQQEYE